MSRTLQPCCGCRSRWSVGPLTQTLYFPPVPPAGIATRHILKYNSIARGLVMSLSNWTIIPESITNIPIMDQRETRWSVDSESSTIGECKLRGGGMNDEDTNQTIQPRWQSDNLPWSAKFTRWRLAFAKIVPSVTHLHQFLLHRRQSAFVIYTTSSFAFLLISLA
jgi:hypothetical protein